MEIENCFIIFVSFLGLISATKNLTNFVNWLWLMFLRPSKNLKETYGSWAIITGCTEGIGKSISLELASKGLNLLLVGRNPSKLEATTEEIEAKFGPQIQVKSVVIDLAESSGDAIAKKITDAIEGLDVGILINNAGLAYPYSRFLHEVDLDFMNSIIKVNAESATWITKSVIRAMLNKKTNKRKGAIVNIGSGSSVVVSSFPLNALYAATKAYLAMFSKSINLEYKDQGIDIQCQIPLFVATRMARVRKSNILIPSAEKYATESIKWIGHNQPAICSPILSHSLQGFLFKSIPESLMDWFQFHFFLGLRNKAIKSQIKKGLITA